jgi:hypothetical protein
MLVDGATVSFADTIKAWADRRTAVRATTWLLATAQWG